MQTPPSIGRYRVTGLIGTGAFSAVYRAMDERVESTVAIKLLADHHSLDADIRERFIAEARLLRRVHSPYVVRLYELDETERHQPYLVLEHVAGGNLAAYRKRLMAGDADIGSDEVAGVAAGVAAALSAMHAQRIIHRDLSPTNLLVRDAPRNFERGDDGRDEPAVQFVLADLGLSKDLAASSGLTAAAGTNGFAAPEQRSAGIVDERADVYAASALLTWFVLGEPPGPDDDAVLRDEGWPSKFVDTLRSGLAEDPRRRPATIGAWHDAVKEALAPPPPRLPRPARTTSPKSRRRGLIAMLVAAVVWVAAGFGAARLLDSGDADNSDSTITRLDDGEVRVERVDDDVTAAFEGPGQLTVGERATFRADVAEGTTVIWVDQSGQTLADEVDLRVTPRSNGTLRLSLVAVDADGRSAVATVALPVAAAGE